MSLPRVLVVSHFFPEHRSGLELCAGQLTTRLAARGVPIEWIASGPLTEPLAPGITGLAVPAANWLEERTGVPYPLWSPGGFAVLDEAVRRADLVHLHDTLYLGNLAAARYAMRHRKPVVVTQHTGRMSTWSNPAAQFLSAAGQRSASRWVLSHAAAPVFYSVKVLRYFQRFTPFRSRPVFIPMGVDLSKFRPLDPDARAALRQRLGWDDGRPVALFVGRFVPLKGLALLRKLADGWPQVRWVMVGWGVIDPRSWGLPQVEVVGSLPHAEVARRYQAADALVLPSTGEGFPLVVQEAMASGLPTLMTDDTAAGHPGIERAAIVCQPTAAAFAAGLERALNAPQPELIRQQAVAFASRYWDHDQSVASHVRLYESLVRASV